MEPENAHLEKETHRPKPPIVGFPTFQITNNLDVFLMAPNLYKPPIWGGFMPLPRKLTCPLKINGWKMIFFPIELVLFKGTFVSFPGCNFWWCNYPIGFSRKIHLPKPFQTLEIKRSGEGEHPHLKPRKQTTKVCGG